MPLDEDPDDERPTPDRLLPPEDRLWRHPSEMGAGLGRAPSGPTGAGPTGVPGGDRAASPPPSPDRRSPALTALAGACLVGAVVAVGAMWIARPTRVVERDPATVRTAVSSVSRAPTFVAGPVPTEAMAERVGPSVARLRIERDGAWTEATALWIDDRGTLAAPEALVTGATQFLVVGTDGVSRSARLAGVDAATGVACLVTDRTAGTPVATSEASPVPGQQTAVVGAAASGTGGGDTTVAGAVVRSASRRASVGSHVIHDTIQLDREVPADAIGGALVDADGDLLGMVVGNSTDRGLGAVVPGATVVTGSTDLRERGKVRRAWLGVRAVDLDPPRASLLGIEGGASITEVTPGSPAAAAGLEVGDVVTAVGEREVDDASDLVNGLGEQEPGGRTVVAFRRDGEPHDVTVTLGG